MEKRLDLNTRSAIRKYTEEYLYNNSEEAVRATRIHVSDDDNHPIIEVRSKANQNVTESILPDLCILAYTDSEYKQLLALGPNIGIAKIFNNVYEFEYMQYYSFELINVLNYFNSIKPTANAGINHEPVSLSEYFKTRDIVHRVVDFKIDEEHSHPKYPILRISKVNEAVNLRLIQYSPTFNDYSLTVKGKAYLIIHRLICSAIECRDYAIEHIPGKHYCIIYNPEVSSRETLYFIKRQHVVKNHLDRELSTFDLSGISDRYRNRFRETYGLDRFMGGDWLEYFSPGDVGFDKLAAVRESILINFTPSEVIDSAFIVNKASLNERLNKIMMGLTNLQVRTGVIHAADTGVYINENLNHFNNNNDILKFREFIKIEYDSLTVIREKNHNAPTGLIIDNPRSGYVHLLLAYDKDNASVPYVDFDQHAKFNHLENTNKNNPNKTIALWMDKDTDDEIAICTSAPGMRDTIVEEVKRFKLFNENAGWKLITISYEAILEGLMSSRVINSLFIRHTGQLANGEWK